MQTATVLKLLYSGDHWYLSLKAKLSRAYATYFTFSMLYLAYQIFLAAENIAKSSGLVKQKLISSCDGAQTTALALVNSPDVLLKFARKSALIAVNNSVKQLGKLFALGIKMLNMIVVWIIHRYTKLIVCMLDTVIGGASATIHQHASEIRDFLNAQIDRIEQVLDAGVARINDALTGIETAGNAITDFFGNGGGGSLKFDLPEVKSALNFEIPESFVTNLKSLTSDPPSFVALEKTVTDAISGPFNFLEKKILDEFNMNISFPDSIMSLSVPRQELVVCDSKKLDLGFIDSITSESQKIFYYLVYACLGIILLGIVANALWIRYWHVREKRQIFAFEEGMQIYASMASCKKRDVWELFRLPLWKRRMVESSSNKRVKWYLNYTLHDPSFFILLFGALGFMSVIARQIALEQIGNKIEAMNGPHSPMNFSAMLRPFEEKYNTSLSQMEDQINEKVLGNIRETMNLLDGTVKNVTESFVNTILKPFDSVPVLRNVVSNFVNCMLASKIEKIEDIIALISDISKITLPRLDTEIFEDIQKTMEKGVKMATSGAPIIIEELIQEAEKEKPFYYYMLAFGASVFVFGVVGVVFWV